MVFKTWLTGLNDVQKAINNISALSTTANGATHLFSNSAVVQQYASALNGLNKEQALLALSYKNLSTQQKEQILAQMGLIASENTIQSELLQTALVQKGVSAEKANAILIDLGLMDANTLEAISQANCTKEDLVAMLAQHGITGAQAEGIISALGLAGANASLTASFELLKKSIWGVIKALATNPMTWVVAGLAGVATVAYQCSQAIEEVEAKAKELNETFSTSKTEIEDYKTQIDDLHKIINDSGSSIKDVTTARQNLMTIQDQLIEKFGDEKDTIDLITDAINGQTSALNTLTEAQWQATKNEFNESGFWNDVANGIDGYSSNIDRMLGEYEGYSVSIDMSEYGGTLFTEGREEFEKMLQDEFGAIQQGSSQTFTLSGDVSEVREKLLDIQGILKENSTYKPDDTFSDYLGGLERSADDVIEKYEDFYKQYVLYEEIFTNDTFTDSYKKINDAYSEYKDAFATGDEESIKKAQDNFANILTQATEGVSDESVVDFFNGMYPDLQEVVGNWQFETNFTANTDGLKDDVSGHLSGLDGLYSYDLKNFSYDTATEEQKASYDGLISVARLYGLTIDQLIDKLVLMGLVQDEEYQKLVDQFGKENIAKIAPEDLTYAYQIKNIGELSFEELQAEIQRLKDEASNPDEITVLSFKDAFNAEDFKDTKENLLELAKSGELTPYTLSSTKEYKTLLDQTGLTAEQVYKKIMKVAKGSMDATDWQTTLDNSRKNIIALKEMKNSLSEDGISAVSSDVVSNYPELIGCLESETDLRKGINGLISDYETKAKEAYFNLVQDSESYYSNLKKNESAKLNTASKTINAIVNANKTLVSQLGGAYNVDLKNFKSVAQAKASLEQQLIINSAKAWSKYYKVQLDASKNTAKVVADGNFNSGGTGGSDSIKAYEEQSKAQNAANTAAKAYNEAINSLKNITYDTVIPEITNPSGNTDKSTKSTTKFSQAIDWCAQTLSKLSKTIDLYSAKLDRNTNSVKTQIKYYKELLNAQNNIVKGYAKTESKYKSTYTKALKKLSKSDQKKVKDGTYTIEQFSGTTKKSGKKSKAEKRYNNIQSALEARDNYLDAQTDSVNAKNQLQQYAEDLAAVRWENATEKVEKLNDKVSLLDTRMSNVSGYKAKNKVLQEQLDLQKKILDKQQEAYDDTQSDANSYYKKISSKYKKNKNSDGTIKTSGVTNQTQLKYIKIYNAYVKKLAKDEIELAQAQEDYTAAVQEAAVARAEYIKTDYDNKISLIDAKANQLDSEIALAEAKGQVASAEYYKLLSDNSNQRLSELENEKKLLKKQLSSTRAYTDEWYEIKQAVIEVDEAIADETVNAVENINKQIEAMKGLTQAKNEYLSGTVGTLDWLEGFTDEEDYYNEDGSFSDKGLAVAKSKLTKSGLYEQQAKNIKGDIDALDEKYKDNQDDANYLKQRMELTQDYQDAMTSWYDEQKSLHDMYINSLKEESEALQDLIDKKKESWEADKSEYDYQKSISEKTKNITDLEKRKAMLAGSTNEEEKAELQKINVELEEAQQDLEDTQYEKQLERMEDALDGLQERFDAIIEKLDKEGVVPSVEEIATIVSDNEKNVETGIKQIIDDAGLSSLLGEKGFEGLNKTANELLTTPVSSITSVIGTTNDWLGQIFEAVSEDTSEDEISLAEALGTYDSKNKTADTSGKSALNKYLMSQGYEAMDTQQMVTLKDAILNSKYSAGMDESLKETLTGITSANNLTKGKDNNYSDNKNAIMNALKYTKANEFISKNATKATKKKSEYGILNKKIYDITGGKVLSKADTLKLGSIFNVKDTDKSGGINADEAKKLVKLLENAGFANGGIVEAVRKNGDDGLATLKVGEAVLTPVQTTAFTELAKNIVPFNNLIGDIVERPNIPTVQSGVGATNTIESINVELNLPNVTDKESFMKMVKSESDVQRMLQNIGFGGVMGSNKKFNVYKL